MTEGIEEKYIGFCKNYDEEQGLCKYLRLTLSPTDEEEQIYVPHTCLFNINDLKLQRVDNESNHYQLAIPDKKQGDTVIRVTYQGGGGSGTVVYSFNGVTYAVTNHHVVCNALREGQQLDVESFDFENSDINNYKGVTVAYEIPGDIALVKLLDKVDLPIAEFYTGEVEVNDKLITAGTTLDSIPAKYLGELIHLNDFIDNGYNYHSTNSFTEGGNSGGPVYLESTGELVGLNARIDEEIGLSYYIPVDRIISFLDENKFQFIYERHEE